MKILISFFLSMLMLCTACLSSFAQVAGHFPSGEADAVNQIKSIAAGNGWLWMNGEQMTDGDVGDFWDGAKYFLQGAVSGFALGCLWQFSPMIPLAGQAIQNTMTYYAYGQGSAEHTGHIGRSDRCRRKGSA